LSGVRKNFRTSEKMDFTQTRQVLWTNPDRAYRERVFKDRANMGDLLLKEGFRELIQKRNDFARRMAKARGKADWRKYTYYRWKYEEFGMDVGRVFDLFERLRRKTDPRMQDVLTRAVRANGWNQLEPWDYDYVYTSVGGAKNPLDDFLPAGAAERNTFATLQGMGFDMPAYGFRLDLYPRDGKSDNAGCFTIVAPLFDPTQGELKRGDIRIYGNLGKGGYEELSTLFHELGHAVHHAESRQYYWLDRNLERPTGTDYTMMEIPSTLFEHFPASEDYLRKYAELANGTKPSQDEISKRLAQFKRMEADQFLLMWRQLLARVTFERRMYEADGENLSEIWSRTMQEHLFVERADRVNAWIERPHFVSSPVYYQAYVLANVGSAQILSYLKDTFGTLIDNPQVGKTLIEKYFRHGRRFEYPELVRNVTGRPLSEDALVSMSFK
jgi:Zn-dependent oligopeptidase